MHAHFECREWQWEIHRVADEYPVQITLFERCGTQLWRHVATEFVSLMLGLMPKFFGHAVYTQRSIQIVLLINRRSGCKGRTWAHGLVAMSATPSSNGDQHVDTVAQ